MKQVFVLQNQDKQFLNKQGEWCDGREARTLYNTEFKDEAINQQFEVSSKDYTLRVTLLRCKLDERRIPQIPNDNLPDAMEMPVEPAVSEGPSGSDEEPTDLEHGPQASLLDELPLGEPSASYEEPSASYEEPETIVEAVVAEVSTVADMFVGQDDVGAANDAPKSEVLEPDEAQSQTEE